MPEWVAPPVECTLHMHIYYDRTSTALKFSILHLEKKTENLFLPILKNTGIFACDSLIIFENVGTLPYISMYMPTANYNNGLSNYILQLRKPFMNSCRMNVKLLSCVKFLPPNSDVREVNKYEKTR
jgi:hypothetical protein